MVGTASLSGTLHPNEPEASIVTGGATLRITLAGDAFWVSCGTEFDAQRQGIIDGMDSNRSEAQGWDAIVKAGLGVGAIVRQSDRLLIMTLTAFSTYDITLSETITVLIPDNAQNDEQEIHPGADAGPGVINFVAMGLCTQINSTQSPAALANVTSQDFSTMGECSVVGVLGSTSASVFAATKNFSAMGAATFVTSTS